MFAFRYFYLICFTGFLREQGRIAKDGVTEEQKKAFALTGGKGKNIRPKSTFVGNRFFTHSAPLKHYLVKN